MPRKAVWFFTVQEQVARILIEEQTPEGLGPTELLGGDEPQDYNRVKRRLQDALRKLEAYDPILDSPLIEEIASSRIHLRRGEKFLDDPNCLAATYAAISDAMAKHASRMRSAIRELAASRSERLKNKSSAMLAAEIKSALDKVIQG